MKPHLNIPDRSLPNIRQAKRILCVFFPLRIHPQWEMFVAGSPIHEWDQTSLSLSKKILLLKSYGHFYRSNPRTPQYMADAAVDFVMKNSPEASLDALAFFSLSNRLSSNFKNRIRHLWTGENNSCLVSKQLMKEIIDQNYDCVLLLYPDAIGYGWEPIEKRFINTGVACILAMNGRRRVFPINHYYHHKLKWRRFLEATWLVEIILFIYWLPVSLILAIYDALFYSSKPVDFNKTSKS